MTHDTASALRDAISATQDSSLWIIGVALGVFGFVFIVAAVIFRKRQQYLEQRLFSSGLSAIVVTMLVAVGIGVEHVSPMHNAARAAATENIHENLDIVDLNVTSVWHDEGRYFITFQYGVEGAAEHSELTMVYHDGYDVMVPVRGQDKLAVLPFVEDSRLEQIADSGRAPW